MTDGAKSALWLIPESPPLQATLELLSDRYRAPRFTAHLTLLGGLALADAAVACRALAELAASHAPLELPITGSGESEDYFTTAFLRCAETAELSALRDRARQRIADGSAPEIGPHISLIYAQLSPAARRAIVRAHAIAGRLRFTAIALVQSGPLGWKPVEQWRTICRHSLHV